MNNNNRGNNRRRGRSNNNRSQGGSPVNRIDSRARGNAPQMLEKYRKLAHDCSLNGDRVQAEYFLQFADHYFRVIADSRVPKDEQRPRRDEDGDYDGEPRRGSYEERFEERFENPRDDTAEDAPAAAPVAPEREAASGTDPSDNPFIRDTRQSRGPRPRDDRRPRRPQRDDRDDAAPAGAVEAGEPASLAAILPPAIGKTDADIASEAAAAEDAPKPRRRTRKPRAEGDGGTEPLEQVG